VTNPLSPRNNPPGDPVVQSDVPLENARARIRWRFAVRATEASMNRALALRVSLGVLCAACADPSTSTATSRDAPAALSSPAAAPTALDPVIQWNRKLLQIVRTPGAQPATVHPTRSFAMLHAAIYDAVNAIEGTHTPYLVRVRGASRAASKQAAAAAAAHDVLSALYPSFAADFDALLGQSLAQVPDGEQKAKGIRIGQDVAARILALRADDGSAAPPIPYVFGNLPGNYQSTPPNFASQPQFTHWSHVSPFALERADQFRPGPPPALTSGAYADAFDEIKSLGTMTGSTATADQALTGRFWNGAIQNYWNEIAQTASVAGGLTTAQNARLFALLNFAVADSVIAFYDAKYVYNFWRPVTAIRAADTDGNPDTEADPNWLPETGKTAPDPSYPGAHAAISAAAAAVLESVLGTEAFKFDVTSEVLPGVVRSFETFAGAAREATLSRVFAGQHFGFDLDAGERLGRQVADTVTDGFLLPRRSGEKPDESKQPATSK
jgi:membrane-associated phospholipid phosphatase